MNDCLEGSLFSTLQLLTDPFIWTKFDIHDNQYYLQTDIGQWIQAWPNIIHDTKAITLPESYRRCSNINPKCFGMNLILETNVCMLCCNAHDVSGDQQYAIHLHVFCIANRNTTFPWFLFYLCRISKETIVSVVVLDYLKTFWFAQFFIS